MAMEEVINNLNEGYEWIIDLDIEKFFDTVNHDKLISILRENVNDATTLHLVRAYLRAGVLDNGLVKSTTVGTPISTQISLIKNWNLEISDLQDTQMTASFSLKAR